MKDNTYDKWLDIPEDIMALAQEPGFHVALAKHLISLDELYRIRYTEGNRVKVCKGYTV